MRRCPQKGDGIPAYKENESKHLNKEKKTVLFGCFSPYFVPSILQDSKTFYIGQSPQTCAGTSPGIDVKI